MLLRYYYHYYFFTIIFISIIIVMILLWCYDLLMLSSEEWSRVGVKSKVHCACCQLYVWTHVNINERVSDITVCLLCHISVLWPFVFMAVKFWFMIKVQKVKIACEWALTCEWFACTESLSRWTLSCRRRRSVDVRRTRPDVTWRDVTCSGASFQLLLLSYHNDRHKSLLFKGLLPPVKNELAKTTLAV